MGCHKIFAHNTVNNQTDFLNVPVQLVLLWKNSIQNEQIVLRKGKVTEHKTKLWCSSQLETKERNKTNIVRTNTAFRDTKEKRNTCVALQKDDHFDRFHIPVNVAELFIPVHFDFIPLVALFLFRCFCLDPVNVYEPGLCCSLKLTG